MIFFFFMLLVLRLGIWNVEGSGLGNVPRDKVRSQDWGKVSVGGFWWFKEYALRVELWVSNGMRSCDYAAGRVLV